MRENGRDAAVDGVGKGRASGMASITFTCGDDKPRAIARDGK